MYMMYATRVIMKPGCNASNNAREIDQIFIEGPRCNTFYSKGQIYDHLKRYPGTIRVGLSPYPDLIPAVSRYGEKYVRSEPNDTVYDNLLRLPRD